MNNRPPLMILLLVLLGAAIVSTGRWEAARPQETPNPVAPETASTVAQPPLPQIPSPMAVRESQCEGTPPSLRPLCECFFALDDRREPGMDDWRLRPWVRRAKGRLRFLIVTIADPEATRDSLRFDRTVESVQTAAESLGYRLDRHWIPWEARVGREPIPGQPVKPADEPGMLLFRSGAYQRALVVFLVGESPISGIRSLMFHNALYYQHALLGAVPTDLYVAGPNYSGSFASLAKAINDAGALSGKVSQIFHVISPSATVKQAEESFRGQGGSRVDYYSIVHNDDYAIWQRFKEYLVSRWDSRQGIAVLSESGTAFGASFRQPTGAPLPDDGLRIQFPREIARLRNAYPDPAAKNILVREGVQQSQEEKLQVPLKDPRVGKDSVPTFAPIQMPVSQEAVLLEIASTMRHERVELANIVSTDVFDSIFLCSYLRRACPDIRLFCANADMLFTRAVENQPLEGILSATTFPLFLRNQFWSPRQGDEGALSLTPMASRYEFGIYNACAALLLKQEGRTGVPLLLEYHWQQQGYANRPPLWLTVVGTNGYWPIALLDRAGDVDPLLLLWPSNGRIAAGLPDPGRPTRLWFYVFWSLTAVCAGFSVLVMLAQALSLSRRADAMPGLDRLLSALEVSPQAMGADGRAFFLMVGSFCLGIMLFVMASPVWMIALKGAKAAWIEYSGVASAIVVLLAAVAGLTAVALHPVVFKKRTAAAGSGVKNSYLWLALASLAFAMWFVYLWWTGVLQGDRHLEGFFAAYRSLDLVNGVSPGLPFLLLAAVILLLSYLHSRRHALNLETPAKLPRLGSGGESMTISTYVQMAAEPLAHPLLSSQPKGVLIFAVGVVFLGFLPWARPLSLESREYDLLYHVTLRLVIVLVLLSWARLLLSWSSLHRLLDRLDRHPLRDAFRRIPAIYSASPILPGRGLHGVEDSICRSRKTLAALLCQPLGCEFRKSLLDKQQLLQSQADRYLSGDVRGRAADVGTLSSIHGLLKETGDLIVTELEPLWQRGSAEMRDSGEKAGSPNTRDLPEAAMRAEELVALQYATFIGIIMLQLRNLLYFVTTGFFLAVVSTLVYPFRSSEQFVWVATAAFIVLGTPVVVALVQVERNEGLKRLTAREEDKMGWTMLRFAAYGALPLLGLISSHFPALGRYLVSLLQPAMQALR